MALNETPTALPAAWERNVRNGPLVSLSCSLRVSLERFRSKVRLSHPSRVLDVVGGVVDQVLGLVEHHLADGEHEDGAEQEERQEHHGRGRPPPPAPAGQHVHRRLQGERQEQGDQQGDEQVAEAPEQPRAHRQGHHAPEEPDHRPGDPRRHGLGRAQPSGPPSAAARAEPSAQGPRRRAVGGGGRSGGRVAGSPGGSSAIARPCHARGDRSWMVVVAGGVPVRPAGRGPGPRCGRRPRGRRRWPRRPWGPGARSSPSSSRGPRCRSARSG